jgi:hypothetical protein
LASWNAASSAVAWRRLTPLYSSRRSPGLSRQQTEKMNERREKQRHRTGHTTIDYRLEIKKKKRKKNS